MSVSARRNLALRLQPLDYLRAATAVLFLQLRSVELDLYVCWGKYTSPACSFKTCCMWSLEKCGVVATAFMVETYWPVVSFIVLFPKMLTCFYIYFMTCSALMDYMSEQNYCDTEAFRQ